MPSLRGLTIIVAGADPARFEAALSIAAAQAALGARARIYMHDQAVGLLGTGIGEAAAALRAEALALGVTITLCQTGLDRAGIAFEALGPGHDAAGLIGLLADLGDDRLIAF
jgi:predicted peroxiredoxin